VRGGDALAKACDLADFLEVVHVAGGVAVDTDAGRVVTTVLLTGETVAEDVANFLAILKRRPESVCMVCQRGGVRNVFREVLDTGREADG